MSSRTILSPYFSILHLLYYNRDFNCPLHDMNPPNIVTLEVIFALLCRLFAKINRRKTKTI